MNNLDKFFNKKLQNREFGFKDEYWKDAERLILEDEARRKRGGYFRLLSLAALLLVGGLIVWLGSWKPGTQNPTPASSAELQAIPAEGHSKTLVDPAVKSKNDNNSTINKGDASNQADDERLTPTSEKANERSRVSTLAKPKSDTSQEKFAKELTPPEKPVLSETVLKNIFENAAESDATESAEKPDVKAVPLLEPIAGRWDNLENPAPLMPKKISIPKPRSFRIGLTAAALFYPSKNNSTTLTGAGFGVIGEYKLLNALSLNAELLYTLVDGNFGATSQTTHTIYGFGKKEIEYRLKPETMHFVELPVYLRYRFGKHGIEGGATLAYLAGLRGSIEKQTSLYPWERPDDGSIPTETHKAGWIAKNDFNTFSFHLNLGYRYFPNQKFALGLRSGYRLGDLLKSNAQQFSGSEPLYFNLSASWYFMK